MKLPKQMEDKIIDVGAMVLRAGSLDPKTKALIAVAAAIANQCSHCHGQCKELARKLGAEKEEIEEAAAIGERMKMRCDNEGGLYRLG